MQALLRRLHRSGLNAAAGLLVLALLWAPGVSQACSACLANRSRANQMAFIGTTIFLSVTPLILIGGIVLWLRYRIRAAQEQPLREAGPPDEISQISRPAAIH